MSIDSNALLALWNLKNIPACDVGMQLPKTFLPAAKASTAWTPKRPPIASHKLRPATRPWLNTAAAATIATT